MGSVYHMCFQIAEFSTNNRLIGSGWASLTDTGCDLAERSGVCFSLYTRSHAYSMTYGMPVLSRLSPPKLFVGSLRCPGGTCMGGVRHGEASSFPTEGQTGCHDHLEVLLPQHI